MSFGLACSSSSPSPAPGGGNPPAPPPSSTEDAGTPPPPPPEVVNGCDTFTDMTANGATIDGPSNAVPAQFAPNCVHVKVGQSVTWNVDLSAHPLAAFGGTSPSPIPETTSGTSVTVMFSAPGTFGYHCLAHPTIMFGAVFVSP
ncbi:MAG TPA: hypothetical protein VGH87_17490 [Polyangiaceae bacterium]